MTHSVSLCTPQKEHASITKTMLISDICDNVAFTGFTQKMKGLTRTTVVHSEQLDFSQEKGLDQDHSGHMEVNSVPFTPTGET